MPSPAEILAYAKRPGHNAQLIEEVAQLGYLKKEWRTLDASWGMGSFWALFRPDELIGCDLDPAKAPDLIADFTRLPFPDRSFDCVVYDPPYRLNGRPDETFDARYGTAERTRWQDRMALIRSGLTECARVLGDGYLLVKCADQVVSQKVRWQTFDCTLHAMQLDFGLVDRLDLLGYRPQPTGRRQMTARRNSSSLLIFKRGHAWMDTGFDR